jgi:transcriptional regulator with XRE-family HTH domain
LRKQRKLTQEKAASLIGCDYKYYQSLESGAKDMRLSMLERISKAFGLKVTVLSDPISENEQGD